MGQVKSPTIERVRYEVTYRDAMHLKHIFNEIMDILKELILEFISVLLSERDKMLNNFSQQNTTFHHYPVCTLSMGLFLL
jgi:hypothetical protein